MKIVYLDKSDTMYMKLKPDARYEESEEVAPGVVLDFDKEGNVIALEIYSDASKKVDLSLLAVEGLPLEGDAVRQIRKDERERIFAEIDRRFTEMMRSAVEAFSKGQERERAGS